MTAYQIGERVIVARRRGRWDGWAVVVDGVEVGYLRRGEILGGTRRWHYEYTDPRGRAAIGSTSTLAAAQDAVIYGSFE